MKSKWTVDNCYLLEDSRFYMRMEMNEANLWNLKWGHTNQPNLVKISKLGVICGLAI
jgi:hypothetical protein